MNNDKTKMILNEYLGKTNKYIELGNDNLVDGQTN